MSERIISFREAIEEGFFEEFSINPNLALLGENVRDRIDPTLSTLGEKFPERVRTAVPLVEEMLGGIALGMSLGGMRPVIQINWSAFITLILDQVYRLGSWRYRMFEKAGPGVLIRVGHDGYDGVAAGSELSSMSLLALINHLPNIWIATPTSPYHAKGLLKTALRENRPILFFEHKALYCMRGFVPPEEYLVSFGCSTKARSGDSLTIISWLYTGHLALEAAELLAQDRIQAEVLILHTLNPIDKESILNSARKTCRIIVVEEGMLRGGMGAEIISQVVENIPQCRVLRIGAKNVPLPAHAKFARLILPGVEDIVRAAKKMLPKRSWSSFLNGFQV